MSRSTKAKYRNFKLKCKSIIKGTTIAILMYYSFLLKSRNLKTNGVNNE